MEENTENTPTFTDPRTNKPYVPPKQTQQDMMAAALRSRNIQWHEASGSAHGTDDINPPPLGPALAESSQLENDRRALGGSNKRRSKRTRRKYTKKRKSSKKKRRVSKKKKKTRRRRR